MFTELLRARAREEPDAVALAVDRVGTLTYGSWDRRSNAFARGLLSSGLGSGDRMVLRFGSSHWTDFAVAYLGVLKAGAVAVPVPDDLSPLELGRIVTHCHASAVLTVADVAGLEVGQEVGALAMVAPPREVAELAFRSGPLSRPQATAHSEEMILAELATWNDDSVPATGGSLLHSSAVGTDAGRQALWRSLQRGQGPVLSLPIFDAEHFCALTEERRITCWLVAPCLALLVLESGALERHDVSSVVQAVLAAGMPSPWLLDRLSEHLPHARLVVTPGTRGQDQPSPTPDDPDAPVIAPVAFSQEGMLWHEVFAPGSQNLPPLVRRYRGRLDVAVLERALSEIVRRHQPLRTTFELRGKHPVQVVAPPRPVRLDVHDLSGMAPAGQEAELDAVLAETRRPFDLVEGPLFAPRLVRLGTDDHVLVLRVHHSVYDDWSVSVFRRELSALYAALRAGEPSPLAEPPMSFTDFARSQRRRLEGPAGASELAWWKDALSGAPLALQLPIHDPDRPEGAPQASPEPVSVELSPALSGQLRALARRERTTVFMAMLAVFGVLVHRVTGQSDLLLASVVANRNRTEVENMIGCFTKKVLVRLAVDSDASFVELLPRIRASLLGALAHQGLAFETVLQEALGTQAAKHGLVPYPVVMFQGVTPQVGEVVLPGLSTAGYHTSETARRSHFSAGDEAASPWGAGLYTGTFLILSVTEGAETISLSARGAFHRPRVERLLASFATLLADIVARPDVAVSGLDLGDGLTGDSPATLDFRGFGIDLERIEVALRRCPGVREVWVSVSHEAPDEPHLVAHVVAAATDGPTLRQLQLAVWEELPGYAWPAAMVVESASPNDSAVTTWDALGPKTPEVSCLASLWAEVLGTERVEARANYWQSFSFLEVVGRARDAGLPLGDQQVTRHRTITTLAADLAIQRRLA